MSSFLTDVQRAALDAALAEKQAAASKQPKGSHHAPTSGPHAGDKKPKNLKGSGASKKGGGGGKFTWGSLLEGEDGVTALDRNDPNYDSDEERAAVLLQASGAAQGRLQAEVAAYKRGVAAIVEEFFSSGDVGNVAASLGDLAAPTSAMGHYFVKRLLTLAMDRRDKEREMASALLSGLYGEGLSAEQLQKGFANTVDALADLTLDVPDAVELLALREFFDAADAQEVAARLLELNQPGLHPLFVKQAVALAMDRRDREREMASNLLGELHPSVITDDQMASGFSRLLAAADDLVLDIPDAVHLLSLFLGR